MGYSVQTRPHIQEALTRHHWFLTLVTVLFVALIQSGCVAPGNLGVSPSNLNFGSVPLGASSSKIVTITNSSNAPFTITQAAVSGKGFDMSVPPLPLTMAVGQTATFTARFAPPALGDASGSLLITKSQLTTSQLTSGSGSATPSITTKVETIPMTGAGVPLTPSITTQPTSQTVTAGQTATFSVTSSGAAPLSYQWRKNGTSISGATSSSYTTPSETTSDGGAQFTVVVSNSAGSVTSNAAILTVSATPGASLQITTSLLPNAQAGIQFQAPLNAIGGAQPYHWSIGSGTLPSGLSLNAVTGLLSGTTSLGGQFDISVQVSDSSSPSVQTAMKPLALSVLAFALQIGSGGLPNGQVGVPFHASLAGDGGVTPYTWTVTGALPAGLILSASSGTIAGMPTQAGTSTFTVVLTDSTGQTTQKSSSITIAAAAAPSVAGKVALWSDVAVTSDAKGFHYYTFSFPGYAKVEIGDGISSPFNQACWAGGSVRAFDSCKGVFGYWDLRNDPGAQWNFGADDTGMFEHQWKLQNNGGGSRIGEMKEGPMTTMVTESNNVRVVITQAGKIRPYGSSTIPADCCITMTKTYAFYRHSGAGSGLGALKVYTQATLNYDGTDGLGPVTVVGANPYSKISYYKISGQIADSGCGSGQAFTLSPWNIFYNTNNYILFGPFANNSSTVGQYLPANPCVSPNGSVTGPEGAVGQPSPGTIYNCVSLSSSGCASQSVSSAAARVSFLQIPHSGSCGLSSITSVQYFYGGLRLYCFDSLSSATLNTNSPASWTTMGWVGDNGITSDATAMPYVIEYARPPSMTPTNATGGSFDSQNGYWTLARTADNVSISANGSLHSPAWLISDWSAASTGMTVGGVMKTFNTDFVAIKTDSTHLLVQYLSDVPANTIVAFTSSSAPAASTLKITSGGLPSGQVGMSFQASLTGSGGVTPYTWAVTGALPAGLSLNASSGTIAGTPTQAGPSAFTIVLTDSMGQSTQNASSIAIASAGSPSSGKVLITPSVPPAANQGSTFQFTANGVGKWSCSGTDASGNVAACKGTIDPLTGLYTAPATVNAQQSYGGYQMLPNNHIFNSRIDSLPLRPDSANLIAGAGTVNLTYEVGFPVNYVNASTPTQNMIFLYTPNNNGPFQIPPYPDVRIEGGWFTRTKGSVDHHLVAIDTSNGTFQEMYQYFDAGQLGGECPTCTSDGGIRYLNSTYDLPNVQGGGTDAAGLYLSPLTIHTQELERAVATGGTINHAVRMTLQNGYLHPAHLWPATADANAGGGVNFYGERIRLRASFDISHFSPIAKILLTQLKQYGLIVADGGTDWAASGPDPGKIPKAYADAFTEIDVAGIAPSNFEAVDESGLMISSTSGETTNNRETVAFTRTSDSATASVDVVLTGVTVGLPNDILYIQAGVTPQQLTAFVHGGANNTITWSMNPSVGTLTAGGLYTPPATSSTIQITTVTATSTDNAGVAAQMTIVIYPNGTIRLIPATTVDYTDTHGNKWLQGYAGDGSWGYDNGGAFPNVPDVTLYKIPVSGGAEDLRFDILVPNGNYQVTGKFAETNPAAGPGFRVESLEAQGVVAVSNLDIYAVTGGRNLPLDETISTTVTNGRLSFVIRGQPSTSNGNIIQALQIAPIP
jgi:putative Ig domain-containing protein/malectin (di-glucose binding ER protein)/ASPM-SPD-2-Hydin domain-containing protein/Ig-like domain-containing protein